MVQLLQHIWEWLWFATVYQAKLLLTSSCPSARHDWVEWPAKWWAAKGWLVEGQKSATLAITCPGETAIMAMP